MTEHAAEAQTVSVAIFGRDEAEHIGACLHAVAVAGKATQASLHVTVLLNGSRDASADVAAAAIRESGLEARLYSIPHADKTNAINQYLHALRPRAALHVFVDAYATVRSDALAWLSLRLAEHPAAQAAAAMPSEGRSAAAMRAEMHRHPGLHGSLFALRGSFVERLAVAKIRLPVGLYRGDGLLGAMVMLDQDAASGGWLTERLILVPEASWAAPAWQPWRWRDVQRHLQRKLRQGRARLEWAALRPLIYRDGFAALPRDAGQMVMAGFGSGKPHRAPSFWRDPFASVALARIRQSGPPPAPEALLPRLLLRTEAT